MDSSLSTANLSAQTANSLSGLLSSLNAMFDNQTGAGNPFASFLDQESGATLATKTALKANASFISSSGTTNQNGTSPTLSLNSLKQLVNQAHNVLEQLNGKNTGKNASAKQSDANENSNSDGASASSTPTANTSNQTQTNGSGSAGQVSSSDTTENGTTDSGDSTDGTGTNALSATDLLSKLALMLHMIEKKLEMMQTASGDTVTAAATLSSDSSANAGTAQTSASDPLSQLAAFFQLLNQQLTVGSGALSSSDTAESTTTTTPSSSLASPALSDLAQLQKDLKALIASMAGTATDGDTDTTDPTGAQKGSVTANAVVTPAQTPAAKPAWAAGDLSNIFGNAGFNIFDNSTANTNSATVNANAGLILANTDNDNSASQGSDMQNSDNTASGGDAAAGLNTNVAGLSNAADNTQAANPYSFASQLSATRATSGGTGLPSTVEQVILQLNRGVKDGNDQITIQLHPADLGKINVSLNVDSDGKVQGTVVANNPATLDLLHKDVRSLERALQDAGLRADPGSLQFSLGGQGNNPGQTAGGNNGGTSSGSGNTASSGNLTSLDVAADTSETYYVTPGRVNLKV